MTSTTAQEHLKSARRQVREDRKRAQAMLDSFDFAPRDTSGCGWCHGRPGGSMLCKCAEVSR